MVPSNDFQRYLETTFEGFRTAHNLAISVVPLERFSHTSPIRFKETRRRKRSGFAQPPTAVGDQGCIQLLNGPSRFESAKSSSCCRLYRPCKVLWPLTMLMGKSCVKVFLKNARQPRYKDLSLHRTDGTHDLSTPFRMRFDWKKCLSRLLCNGESLPPCLFVIRYEQPNLPLSTPSLHPHSMSHIMITSLSFQTLFFLRGQKSK